MSDMSPLQRLLQQLRQHRLLALSLCGNFLLLLLVVLMLRPLGGPSYLWFRLTHMETGDGVSTGRSEHFRLLRNTPGETVFLGDSITAQAEWAELLADSRMKNRGIGGNRASQMLHRVDEVAASQPERVFLMAGVNDLLVDPPQHVVNSVQALVRRLHQLSPQTTIYLQSLLPVNNSLMWTRRDNADINFINRQLMDWAARQPYVEWVDLHRVFRNGQGVLDPVWSYDGLHLNGEAYLKWRDVLLPLLRQNL
ncbi:MAG: GDSL-type esterase/lipase family protein [Marinobacterium sp.]|nr:GDSL-type esterase/lipase family protein [Marinobacterium sp.]